MKKRRSARKIVLKQDWEIAIMRVANLIVAQVLKKLESVLEPGISTWDLELIATEEIQKQKAIPAFKGYRGYPAALCVSINNEVVHGIPSKEKILKAGDLVSMDIGVIYEGYYGDAAISTLVGDGSDEAKKLIDVTRNSLYKGIKKAIPGGRLRDISAAIQEYVEKNNFSVVKHFVGHGIGRALHEPPEVPNFGIRGQGPVLKAGMVLAIEPMVNVGSSKVRVLEDGWTAVTIDDSLSAHFEHSVAITEEGPVILSSL